MTDNESVVLSENVKKLRKERGLTQEKLAEKADISLGTVKNLENARRPASGQTLELLAKVFGCSVGDFYKVGENEAELGALQVLMSIKEQIDAFLETKPHTP